MDFEKVYITENSSSALYNKTLVFLENLLETTDGYDYAKPSKMIQRTVGEPGVSRPEWPQA